MRGFTRHFRCAKGHTMTTNGTELTQCQAYVGPVRKRVPCDAEVREVGRVRKQGARGG